MKLDQDPEAPTPARRSGSLMDAAITAPGLFRDTTWKEVRGPYEKERQAGRHCGSKSWFYQRLTGRLQASTSILGLSRSLFCSSKTRSSLTGREAWGRYKERTGAGQAVSSHSLACSWRRRTTPGSRDMRGSCPHWGVVFSAPSHSDAQRCRLLDHTSLWFSWKVRMAPRCGPEDLANAISATEMTHWPLRNKTSSCFSRIFLVFQQRGQLHSCSLF